MRQDSRRRYLCVVCWRHTPWSQGCADDVDVTVAMSTNLRDPATSDTGICDDCWVALGGANLVASVSEVAHDQASSPLW